MVRYFVGEQIQNPRAHRIEIGESEFKEVLNAKNVIIAIHSMEIKFQIITECFRRIEIALFEIALDGLMESKFDREISSEIVIRLNQELLSFLTAVRAYRDQQPQDLGSFSTLASPWAKNAKKLFGEIFDSSFEFRVMEAVRNHAQHSRLPITRFHIGSSRQTTEANVSTFRYTVDPEIDLIEVAGNPKLRRKTRDEIKDKKVEWIDLKLAVRKYLSDLVIGHNQVRTMLFNSFADAKQIYATYADRYRTSAEMAADAAFVMVYTESNNYESIYLGIDVVEEVERLVKLHPTATGLSERYVSNEVVRIHANHPSSAQK